MSFNEIIERQEKEATEGSGFAEIRELLYKLEGDAKKPTSCVLRVNPDNVFEVWEVWLTISDNIPEDKDDARFIFYLKNKSGWNNLASVYGNPQRWKLNKKKKADPGLFANGILAFDYSEHKNEKGYHFREYEHMNKPEYKEFFSTFCFNGEKFDENEYPKNAPTVKYYCEVTIAEDEMQEEKKMKRWMILSNKQFQTFAGYHKNGFLLEKTWFKLERVGTGVNDTEYTIYTLPPDVIDSLNGVDYSSYGSPELDKITQLSNDYYTWKYLQTHIIESDKITGNKFAEIIKAGHDELAAEYEANSDSESAPREEKKSSNIPDDVKNEFSDGKEESDGQPDPVEEQSQRQHEGEAPATAGVGVSGSGAKPQSLSDDDIPF